MRPAGERTDRVAVPPREIAAASPGGGLDAWLRRRRPAVVAAIALVAALVRIVVFVQLSHGPVPTLDRWDATDMHFVDEWGRTLAGGSWLVDEPLHPYPSWAREIMDAHLGFHPDIAEALAAEVPGAQHEERARYLWNKWSGGKRFHQEPLYAYLVGATYRVLGVDPRWVFAWQMIAGIALTVLLYLAVCRPLGDTVAAVAALLAALAAPLVYQELVLLRESLVAFAGVALVYLTGRAFEQPRATAWLGLGVALGLAVLLELVFLAYGVVVLLVLLAARRTAALRPAAVLIAGAALAIAPAVGRNLAVGVPPLAFTSSDGLMFLESNAVDYRAGVGFVVSERTQAVLAETQGRFWPTASWTLSTHPDRASMLRMLGAKTQVLWNWHEVPNNGNFYFARLHSAMLRALPVTFFVLAPLGLVGLVLGLGSIARLWPLTVLVLCHVGNLLVFSPLAAPRVPLQAAIAPFAALTLVEVVRAATTGRGLRAAGVAVATVAVSAWTARPLAPGLTLVGSVDYWAAYQTFYRPAIEEAERSGDFARAADVFRASLAFEPDALRAVDSEHPATGAVADMATLFASVHEAYANELERGGRHEDAQREMERARVLAAAVPPPPPPPAAEPESDAS